MFLSRWEHPRYGATCTHIAFRKIIRCYFYVFLQQVWCVDNCVTILYLYATFNIIKCDKILLNKKLCYCRGNAQHATSVEIFYGRYLTKLLTNSANAEEPCEHIVSRNCVKCSTNVWRIAFENVCKQWMSFKIIQDHCLCYHLIGHILFPISLPL